MKTKYIYIYLRYKPFHFGALVNETSQMYQIDDLDMLGKNCNNIMLSTELSKYGFQVMFLKLLRIDWRNINTETLHCQDIKLSAIELSKNMI